MRVCVFAGSAAGARAPYLAAARELGADLARRGWGLVYGGASVGLMGACADAALQGGAEVIGVLPRALSGREIAHPGLTELRIVDSLHERKAMMGALCDAYAVLPGGCGTMDEVFEAITWGQLGLHDRPMAFVDAGAYFGPFFALIQHMTVEGFLRSLRLIRAPTAGGALDGLVNAPPLAEPALAPPPRP